MALMNIGAGNKDDAFYRYKMPKMIPKIEGRGNGIKTNIVNMVDIAKALSRPASYITKHFGFELGAQSNFSEKNGTSTYTVNGSHDVSKLSALLEIFIKKFVQCYGCGNPETEIIITKTQMINLKCAACGYISEVDMRDKLTGYILKNPPEAKKGTKDKKAMRRAEKERLKEGEAADEELKKVKKDAAKKKGSSSTSLKDSVAKTSSKKKSHNSDEDHSPSGSHAGDNGNGAADESDDDDVEWQTDTSAAAAQQRIQEQLNAVTASMVMLTPTEEKPKSGKNSPAREVKSKVNGDANGAKAEKLVDLIKEYLNKGSPASQLKSFLDTLTEPPQKKMEALFEALFEGAGKGFSKDVLKKKNFLRAVIQEEEGSQTLLLNAIELFCGKASAEAVKEVALVLKGLYDNDVLEEEFVVEWYEKGLKGSNKGSPIWKNVKPFVEWLQSAESETEDE